MKFISLMTPNALIATLNDRLSQFNFRYSEKSDTPTKSDIRDVKNADTKIGNLRQKCGRQP